MSKTIYEEIVEASLADEDLQENIVKGIILNEARRNELLGSLEGDKTLLQYLLLFEEYLDQHDIYMFKGWKDKESKIIGKPTIGKFYFTVFLNVKKGTDLRGIKRIKDANSKTNILGKRQKDGSITLKIEMLKSLLDKIDADNKEKIENMSDKALQELDQ